MPLSYKKFKLQKHQELIPTENRVKANSIYIYNMAHILFSRNNVHYSLQSMFPQTASMWLSYWCALMWLTFLSWESFQKCLFSSILPHFCTPNYIHLSRFSSIITTFPKFFIIFHLKYYFHLIFHSILILFIFISLSLLALSNSSSLYR